MENKEPTPEESLKIITSMIEASKQKIMDNGNIWLMWGYYVIIASSTQLLLANTTFQSYSWLGWMLWPIGVIATIISSRKQRKESQIKTHVDEFMTSLWTAFGIAIAICIAFTMQLSHLAFLPFCMILYGIGTFTSGAAIKFKPLKYGGLICFLCAAIAFNVTYDIQLILIIVAVVCSYIIPGYMLRAQYKKENA